MSAPESTRGDDARRRARQETDLRLEGVLDALRSRLDHRLLGVLLVGSVAGDGESYLVDGGQLFLLSDIDLYCVVSSPSEDDRASVNAVRRSFVQDRFLTGGLDLALVAASSLSSMDDALKAQRAREAHRWLFRREGSSLPQIGSSHGGAPAAIDGFRLLCNRAGEELLHTHPDGRPQDSVQASYARWKLMRDARVALEAAVGADGGGLLECASHWPRLADLLAEVEHIETDFVAGPVDAARIRAATGVDTKSSDRRTSHARLLASTWPLYRFVAWRLCEPGLDLRECIERAEGAGEGCLEGDARLFAGVPRRGGALRALRRAYRYRKEAAPKARPWWRNAVRGAGPERVQAAAALAFAGCPDATRILLDLYEHPESMEPGSDAGVCPALWTGQQWRKWILHEG